MENDLDNLHEVKIQIEKNIKKLFEIKIKLSRYEQWYDEIIISALFKGEQFLKDHSRPMTYEEKKEWADSKRKLLKF